MPSFKALPSGLYNDSLTFGELKEHRDFGMGTFNNLDGEMLGFDGTFYQIRSDGNVYVANDSMKTPFA